VSLLLGCGYDAYVVGGYAPSDIAQNDQSSQTCPLLEAEFSLRNKEAETSGPATSQGVEAGTKYQCAPVALHGVRLQFAMHLFDFCLFKWNGSCIQS